MNPSLYLNIIWHQHQPLYLDPEHDQLQAPWVRTHATKDYFDMAALVGEFPDVHCTFNLTSSLLVQLEEYYVRRLGPFCDSRNNRIDTASFFSAWKGKTDPWIDIALTPTAQFGEAELDALLHRPWNALFINEVMVARFPEYKALKDKAGSVDRMSEQEMREIKFWFFLAYFDPDFLERPVPLPDGSVVDLSDLVQRHIDGTYRLKKVVGEQDCNRIVAEAVKIMTNIVPIHRRLLYDPKRGTGQIDIITTPFYHPILPLLCDSDVARECQPDSPLPQRFAYPDDAHAQTVKAKRYFKELFGVPPVGMWPAEGSVSEDALRVFAAEGIQWIAADEKILARSDAEPRSLYVPYAAGNGQAVGIVFRDTRLSDNIGFVYQTWKGSDGAMDFLRHVVSHVPRAGEEDRLLTVILDGENAWEWYRHDNDGKEFLRTLYESLGSLFRERSVTTVTMSEYIGGNPGRGIPPHPLVSMKPITRLHPGSWINANFDTCTGIPEKNKAWEYLRTARRDLASSGVLAPDPSSGEPRVNTRAWYAYRAWEEMYAAEGSDWFWWYGTKHYVPGGIAPFDRGYTTHLRNVYEFARRAGGTMPERGFPPLHGTDGNGSEVVQGAMKQSADS